jgi:polysaccharide export outer membrane protein
MRRAIILLLFVLILGLPAMAGAMEEDYILGPGDLIEVSVWGETELSREMRIRPDGKIAYPLVGETMAAGRTIENLRQEFEAKVNDFIPKAPVTIILSESSSKRYFVIGKVASPGAFPMYDSVNVMQALAIAGGLNQFADEDSILIIRDNGGQKEVIRFDHSDIVRGKRLEQNILLQSKDIIIVR